MNNTLVIVTGGTSGIGKAAAELLLESGYDVVVLGRDKESLSAWESHSSKGRVIPYAIDLSQPDQISDFLNSKEIPWDNIYGLVNCAGVTTGSDIFELSLEDWQYDMQVNLQAPFLLMQGVMNKLVTQKLTGSIVNISSMVGYIGAKKPNYSASKSGLLGLTKSAALRGGAHNIRVNAIAPGAVKTPMTADWDDEKVKMITANTPLGRLAEPSDIANIVLWLISADSSFVTGAVINATGGQYTGQ